MLAPIRLKINESFLIYVTGIQDIVMKWTPHTSLRWAVVLMLGWPLQVVAQRDQHAVPDQPVSSYVSVRARAEEIPSLDRNIAVNLDGASLQQALAQIASHTGLRLTYSADLLPEGYRLSLRAPRITAAEAVRRALRGTTLDLLVAPSGEAVLVRCPPIRCGNGIDGSRARTSRDGSRRLALDAGWGSEPVR